MSKNKKTINTKSTKMGAYSAFLTLVVIAFVIVVNLMVGELPSTVTKLDTSSLQLYTLSDTTTSMLQGLNEDVTFYYIVQKGQEDTNIEEILNRYASYSSHIAIKKIDPTSNPNFSTKYTDDELDGNSVIVESAKRSWVVAFEDIYVEELDMANITEQDYINFMQYGQPLPSITYFSGESALTTALDFVTSDNLPVLYIITGHGETTVADEILADAKAENILTEELSLLTVTEIPEDAGAVLLNVPTQDLTETERDVLLSYMELGGKVILITDYTSYTTASMPNLAAVAAAYGLQSVDGLVIEGNTNHYVQAPYFLLPQLNADADVAMNLASANVATILQFSHGIQKIDGTDKYVEGVLTTSGDAYVIADLEARIGESADAASIEEALKKRDEDVGGPLHVAAYAEDLTTGGKFFWIASSSFINDGGYSYTSELFMSSLTVLCEKSSSISILGKAMQIQSLAVSSAAAGFWGILLCLILPIGTAVIGLVFWNKRRKR